MAMSELELHSIPGIPRLTLRHRRGTGPAVLYVHGATFPAALSVGYRFDGRSWEDDWVAAGFDVWALDFEGYGASALPSAFEQPANTAAPLLRASQATAQIARAVDYLCTARRDSKISIVAHSWGTIAAASFAASHPDIVPRLVLFGPILPRPRANAAPDLSGIPAWRLITVAEQLARFRADVPAGTPNILAEPELAAWGPAWLASQDDAAARTPPAVKVPSGSQVDIGDMWSGKSVYDPARLTCPTMVIRGAWDSLCTNDDVARFIALSGSAPRLDVVVPRATHLMHLEDGRHALWAATRAFLGNGDPVEAARRARPS
jgi:pimeloyl-ACP methyl ester carboxylesterase